MNRAIVAAMDVGLLPEDVDKWLDRPSPLFSGHTPRAWISCGRENDVIDAVERIRDLTKNRAAMAEATEADE